jgi:adenosylcobinamide-phosphate synthase
MIFFSLHEILFIVLSAIIVDWLIGDPRWLIHPVTILGKLIRRIEYVLSNQTEQTAWTQRLKGVLLLFLVAGCAFVIIWWMQLLTNNIALWLCYIINIWFISTTIACKGLKDAALAVFNALQKNDVQQARVAVSMIVGRDTAHLDEPEIVRATVETVAENTVDAYVAPIFYALLGAAPLAILYRAVNTLDSMVGYKNQKYLYFGWASARADDVLNFIPARLTGIFLGLSAFALYGPKAMIRSWKSINQFARLHPSPNSGIPESAVAGALHVRLGGTNQYGEIISHRAYMGWPNQTLRVHHIRQSIRMLYVTSYYIAGGIVCLLCWQLYSF